MKYCNRCVMPDTKPGVTIDDEGVCNACRSVEARKDINWEERKQELLKLCNEIKKNNKGGEYDCLVPVSGGKDSIYQVWYMKNICKMNVLAVCVIPHLRTKEGIKNFDNMLKHLDIDAITVHLKESTFKGVRRQTFKKLAEPNWADHCTVMSSVARIALAFKIPLVVWGEDISVEYGGKTAHKRVASADNIIDNELIKSKKIEDWYDNESVTEKDTFFYRYPEIEELKKNNIRSIYLGYYDKWDGYEHFLKAKEVAHFTDREKPLSGNYLTYDNIDEKLCEMNIWLKYIKFGFWRPTDQCCYHIWNERMKREEAIKIVNKLQDEFPVEYFRDWLDFHGLTQKEFWEVVEKFRNKDIWENTDGKWKLKYPLK